MSRRWINTKVEFIWDGTQYVEQSAEGYWYDGEMALCTSTTIIDADGGTVHYDTEKFNSAGSQFSNNERYLVVKNSFDQINDGNWEANIASINDLTSTNSTSEGTKSGGICFGDLRDIHGVINCQKKDSSTHAYNMFYGGFNGDHVFTSFLTNGSELMRVKSDGNVGIGTDSPNYKLEVTGSFYSSGSSVDFKKHVTDMAIDSSAIYDLNPVSYEYKKDYKDFGYDLAGGKQVGLLSEDVANTVPELAIMKDGKAQNVDYQKLSVLLLAEMKKLNKRLEALEAQ